MGVKQGSHGGRVPYIGLDGDGLPAGLLDLAHDLRCQVCAGEVVYGDGVSLAGQPERRRRTNATGGARNHGRTARTGQIFGGLSRSGGSECNGRRRYGGQGEKVASGNFMIGHLVVPFFWEGVSSSCCPD